MASRRGSSWAIWLLILVVYVECLVQQTSGQFFTKSSKSIPRMGRRSQPPLNSPASRRAILYRLLDTYGPEYLNTLQVQMKTDDQSSPGEIVYANEQPFDFVGELSNSPGDAGYYAGQFGRDERSSKGRPMESESKDKSLAMRAFDVDRYIKHLSSGRPLMSIERMLDSKQPGGLYTS